MNDRVILNIGGTRFETTWSTLSPAGYFKSIYERFLTSSTYPNSQEIFVDRDPENFREVLSFLRDQQHQIPKKLLYELEFYGIDVEREEPTPEPPFETLLVTSSVFDKSVIDLLDETV